MPPKSKAKAPEAPTTLLGSCDGPGPIDFSPVLAAIESDDSNQHEAVVDTVTMLPSSNTVQVRCRCVDAPHPTGPCLHYQHMHMCKPVCIASTCTCSTWTAAEYLCGPEFNEQAVSRASWPPLVFWRPSLRASLPSAMQKDLLRARQRA